MGDETLPAGGGPLREIRVRVVREIGQVSREAWDGLEHGRSPFLRWGFLRALELSGSVGPGSGWHPFYLLAEDDRTDKLVAAVPAYVKSHSYGEYIFDWAWAGACERAGIAYYPKLVVAAPVTPATGNRILVAPGQDPAALTEALAGVVRQLAQDAGCSSIHWLFTTADEQDRLAALGFAPRASLQYHWRNRGYGDFDDFLSTLKSRKRKQMKRERRRVAEAIDGLEMIPGGELSEAQVDTLDRMYRANTHCHGGMDYLQPGFFHRLVELMPDTVLMAEVKRAGEVAACALFLETDEALYGRYWGADEHVEFLHFETAYYAGIERCITRGTALFEAGAQGHHKLLRGFEPCLTHSAHQLFDERLDDAVREFLRSEAQEIDHRIAMARDQLPYKRPDS